MTTAVDTARRLTRGEVLRHTGLTYRRADYWVRRGVLGDLAPTERGSGSQRAWTIDAVHALTVCRRVADAAMPEQHADTYGASASVQFPLDTLRLIVAELVACRFPVAGFILSTGAEAVWCPDIDAVEHVLTGVDAAIVTALRVSDRPE